MAKVILKKDKIGEFAPMVIWIYFKATVIKTVRYGAKTDVLLRQKWQCRPMKEGRSFPNQAGSLGYPY